MLRFFIPLLVLCLCSATQAKPDWTTIEGYIPERTMMVLSMNCDRQARSSFLESVPLDTNLVNQVLDEQFGAFAKLTGLNLLDATELFAAVGAANKGDMLPAIGLKVPVDRAKVAQTIKGSGLTGQGWKLQESDSGLVLEKGRYGWAFASAGIVVWGSADALAEILKRKGAPADSNKEIISGARAKTIEAGRLHVRALFAEGLLPKSLPPTIPLKKYGLPDDLSTRLAAALLVSTADVFYTEWEFRDDQTVKKVNAAIAAWLKDLRAQYERDLNKMIDDSGRLGVLAPLAPEVMTARLNLMSFDEVVKSLAVHVSGRTVAINFPTKVLPSLKGLGGVGLLSTLTTAILPRLRSAAGIVPAR